MEFAVRNHFVVDEYERHVRLGRAALADIIRLKIADVIAAVT
jgi:hypothetical protein